ncbi:MAG TPA: hypothetical protein VI542_33585 [Candidatus Tectomicrobia bacterium]
MEKSAPCSSPGTSSGVASGAPALVHPTSYDVESRASVVLVAR